MALCYTFGLVETSRGIFVMARLEKHVEAWIAGKIMAGEIGPSDKDRVREVVKAVAPHITGPSRPRWPTRPREILYPDAAVRAPLFQKLDRALLAAKAVNNQ